MICNPVPSHRIASAGLPAYHSVIFDRILIEEQKQERKVIMTAVLKTELPSILQFYVFLICNLKCLHRGVCCFKCCIAPSQRRLSMPYWKFVFIRIPYVDKRVVGLLIQNWFLQLGQASALCFDELSLRSGCLAAGAIGPSFSNVDVLFWAVCVDPKTLWILVCQPVSIMSS